MLRRFLGVQSKHESDFSVGVIIPFLVPPNQPLLAESYNKEFKKNIPSVSVFALC